MKRIAIVNWTLTFLLSGLAVCVAACNASGDGASGKCPFEGVEKYVIAYCEDTEGGNLAYDQMKEGIEAHLTAAVGGTLKTKVDAEIATVETPFTIVEASGNVGRSAADPYVVLAAGLRTDEERLGFICRDKDDLPVFVGKADVSEGSVQISVPFGHDGAFAKWIALYRVLSSMVSVELVRERDFDDRVLYCTGESYNKKGFGRIAMGADADDVPDAMPGVYDSKELVSRVEEGPEDDYTILEIILKKDGEKVAGILYSDEDNRIYEMEIRTPEVFALESTRGKNGQIPLHCKTDACILLDAGRGQGFFDVDKDYQRIAASKIGMASFQGMEVVGKDDYGKVDFGYDDLVPGARADRIVLAW